MFSKLDFYEILEGELVKSGRCSNKFGDKDSIENSQKMWEKMRKRFLTEVI